MIYVTFQRAEPGLASNARRLPPDVQLSCCGLARGEIVFAIVLA